MKILSIIGTRPQYVKFAPFHRAVPVGIEHVVVDTGQHYDASMSNIFYEELGIPLPRYNLAIGSGQPAVQVGRMMIELQSVLGCEDPDVVVVFGDTNSTLAGALAAQKSGYPVAHVEAGCRSYQLQMPEEQNRVVVDHVSSLHLCATHQCLENLKKEGISKNVFFVGDLMHDVFLLNQESAQKDSAIASRLGLPSKGFVLLTVHRAESTSDANSLKGILEALNTWHEPVVFPVHPRTRKLLDSLDLKLEPHIRCIEPVGYLDMLALEAQARIIATDSGGVQREAYLWGVPCITLRDVTEWPETVEAGWNLQAGPNGGRLLAGLETFAPTGERPPVFGDGQTGKRIWEYLNEESQESIWAKD